MQHSGQNVVKKQSQQTQITVPKVIKAANAILELNNNEVIINKEKKIPLNTIQEVIFLPILKNAPVLGGCLKFVTADNPGIPERTSHSFCIPGTKITNGWSGAEGNFFWFNTTSFPEVDLFNKEAEEIKKFIESRPKMRDEAQNTDNGKRDKTNEVDKRIGKHKCHYIYLQGAQAWACDICGMDPVSQLLHIFPAYTNLEYNAILEFKAKNLSIIEDIGKNLNDIGGYRLMLTVGKEFQRRATIPQHASLLNSWWNGIGDWQD
ncbi:MAG: hypothetical protein LBL05_07730 [Synergistaceae bacterium]|jgi:hypothetical protein|nr:hypothetical protein [Synergistaceae bacterium]